MLHQIRDSFPRSVSQRPSTVGRSPALRLVTAFLVCMVGIAAVSAGRAQESNGFNATPTLAYSDIDATPFVSVTAAADRDSEIDVVGTEASMPTQNSVEQDGGSVDGGLTRTDISGQGTPASDVEISATTGAEQSISVTIPLDILATVVGGSPIAAAAPIAIGGAAGGIVSGVVGAGPIVVGSMTFPAGKNGVGEVTGTFGTGPLQGCTFAGKVKFFTRDSFYIKSDQTVGDLTVTCPARGKMAAGSFDIKLNLTYPAGPAQKPGMFYDGTIAVVKDSGKGGYAGVASGTINVKSRILPNGAGQSVELSFTGFPPGRNK